MAHNVFISYSSKDKTTADAACAILEADGIRCWIAPRDVLPGAGYGGQIVRAISSCNVMILVFSSHANRSRHVLNEIERAVSKGAIVIPVRIEDVIPSEELELFLSTPHWLDALSPPLEEHILRLVETVKLLLRHTAEPGNGASASAVTAPSTMRPQVAAKRIPNSETPASTAARQASHAGALQVLINEACGFQGNGIGTINLPGTKSFFEGLDVGACREALAASNAASLSALTCRLSAIEAQMGGAKVPGLVSLRKAVAEMLVGYAKEAADAAALQELITTACAYRQVWDGRSNPWLCDQPAATAFFEALDVDSLRPALVSSGAAPLSSLDVMLARIQTLMAGGNAPALANLRKRIAELSAQRAKTAPDHTATHLQTLWRRLLGRWKRRPDHKT